jgi:hypothetical protein
MKTYRSLPQHERAGLHRAHKPLRPAPKASLGESNIARPSNPESEGCWLSPPRVARQAAMDRTLRGSDSEPWQELASLDSAISRSTVCRCLFHEIGHHTHFAIRPEYREKEDVADYWKRKLDGYFPRKRHWYLLPFAMLRKLFKRIGKR